MSFINFVVPTPYHTILFKTYNKVIKYVTLYYKPIHLNIKLIIPIKIVFHWHNNFVKLNFVSKIRRVYVETAIHGKY